LCEHEKYRGLSNEWEVHVFLKCILLFFIRRVA
jgi:hypothetical protein